MSTPRYLPNFPDELVVKANYDKAVEGLGKISVAFQQLEDSLKIGVGKLVDPNDVQLSTILTAQLSFQAILDLFGALYQHRFNNGAEQKELRKFLGQCEVAGQSRNRIIHSHWRPDTIGGKGAVRTKFTARKALKGEQQVLSGADLLKEADGLRALRDTYLKVWTPRIIRYVNTVPVPKAIYLPKEI